MVVLDIILVLLFIVALVGGYTAIKLLQRTRNLNKKIKIKFTISERDSITDIIFNIDKINTPIDLNKKIVLTNKSKDCSKEPCKQSSEISKQEKYVEPYALI